MTITMTEEYAGETFTTTTEAIYELIDNNTLRLSPENDEPMIFKRV